MNEKLASLSSPSFSIMFLSRLRKVGQRPLLALLTGIIASYPPPIHCRLEKVLPSSRSEAMNVTKTTHAKKDARVDVALQEIGERMDIRNQSMFDDIRKMMETLYAQRGDIR